MPRKEIKEEPKSGEESSTSSHSPSPKRERRDRDRKRSRERERKQSPVRRRSRERRRSVSPRRDRSRERGRDSRDRQVVRSRKSPDRRRSPIRRERDRNSRKYDEDRVKREPESPEREKNGKSEKYGLERQKRREDADRWGKPEDSKKDKEEPVIEKEKVNLGTSGKLAEDTNTFRGVVIKYNEPPEAKKPIIRWRLYPFKGDEALPALYIHRQSAYLIGRDRKVADIPVDHPSCSKQHAALQYRSITFERDDGSKGRHTLPYIIDLASGNGTYLNGEKIEPQRYYELKEKDMLKFGFSTREYVMLSEKATEDDSDQEPVSDRSDI